jgi:hypothetical protein
MGKFNNNGATPWISNIGLGSPAQPLRFMIDTGTMNTWITAAECDTDACLIHKDLVVLYIE